MNKTTLLSFVITVALAILLSLTSSADAQNEDVTREELEDLEELSSIVHTRQATETTGTPYLNPDFLKGKIMLYEDSATQTLYLRYNSEQNKVEFIRNGEVLVTDASKISGFKIFTKGENIVFKNGYKTDAEGINQNTLLRLVYNGNLKLLAKHSSTLNKDLASYGTAVQENKYVKRVTYYLVTSDGSFQKLKLNKGDILDHLGEQAVVEEYARNNGLSFDKEEDVKQILSNYENDSI